MVGRKEESVPKGSGGWEITKEDPVEGFRAQSNGANCACFDNHVVIGRLKRSKRKIALRDERRRWSREKCGTALEREIM